MKYWTFAVPLMLLGLLAATACQGEAVSSDGEVAAAREVEATAVVVDQSKLWEKWQQSPHSHTYDLGKGPNTYCSRCHSPRNWDPEAVVDPPPNCVSCKFEFEDEPRIAAGNPLVPTEQWLDIRCDICHEVNEGLANPEPVWWDQAAAQYVPVTYNSALCEQCHTDTATLQHQRDMGDKAHIDFQCTDCHDAHSVAASCSDSRCHADLSPEYHGADAMETAQASDHTAVSCVACHDSSGLEVGPLEGEGEWVTWRTTELMGRATAKPYQSHATGLTVNCERCHFEGNPWNLTVSTQALPAQ